MKKKRGSVFIRKLIVERNSFQLLLLYYDVMLCWASPMQGTKQFLKCYQTYTYVHNFKRIIGFRQADQFQLWNSNTQRT